MFWRTDRGKPLAFYTRLMHGGMDEGDVGTDAILALAGKPPEELTFGERLNLLWAAVRPRRDEDPQAWNKVEVARKNGKTVDVDAQGRPQYTNTWVAQQLAERFGVSITPSYLGKLRHADKLNPGVPVLTALAQFFNVDTGFLLPVTTRSDQLKVAGVKDNLLTWITSARPVGAGGQGGIAIELRIPGATTPDEAQRQVALALAQWLEDQRNDRP